MIGPGNDVSLAFRMLLRQPGFTTIALLTLALSIGATTAIFSVVNGIVLRPLPFAESERLIVLFEKNVQRGWTTFSVAPANFVDWARSARTFESMVALSPGSAALSSDRGAEQVPTTYATAEIDVLRAGLRLSVIGGVVGLTAAWLLSDALPLQFFKTGPHDAFTFVSVPVVLLLTALLACSIPARRASRLDPIEALRE